MNSTVTKVKTNFAADSERFEFRPESTIPARKGLTLVITAVGGPIVHVQASLYDVNDVLRDAIGVPEHGAPCDTGGTGSVEWDFSADGCAGGYLKWRCWASASAAGLQAYTITEEIQERGNPLCRTTVRGVIPDGAQVDTPFLDGVQIRGNDV